MNDLTKLIIASIVTGALALSGCGDKPSEPSATTHTDDDGHDHGASGHEDHDHDHGDDAHDDHDDHDDYDDHDHGAEHALGSVEIGGTTLEVSISGDIKPDSEIHVDIVQTAGPTPAAVRLWVGVQSGTGSLKSKADGHGNHFHGHAEVPSQMSTGTALWIEVESASGDRSSESLDLP